LGYVVWFYDAYLLNKVADKTIGEVNLSLSKVATGDERGTASVSEVTQVKTSGFKNEFIGKKTTTAYTG
jgi:hypothetical protein